MILHADSDKIFFCFTTNLHQCVVDICWVSIAVVLVENNVLFLVPTRKVLEIVFPKCF